MATSPFNPGDTQAEVVAALTNAQTCVDGITGGGTSSQANATPLNLPGRFYHVTSTSSSTNGVTLPSLKAIAANATGAAGQTTPWCVIRNDGGVALLVYGNNSAVTVGGVNYTASNDQINAQGAGVAFSVGVGKSALFFANSVQAGGNWCTLLSA